MPDQAKVIPHLLKVLGLSGAWHVLEPVPGDLSSLVVIENKLGRRVVVPISTKEVENLPDEILIGRIRAAIAESTPI